MKIENIDIQATIKKAQVLVRDDKQLSGAMKSIVEILILIISPLANRLNLNSKNSSSKSLSSDPNRKKLPKSKTGKKGHVGTTLKKIDDPDKVMVINVDRSKLPPARYRQNSFETCQVFDIDISRVVKRAGVEITRF